MTTTTLARVGVWTPWAQILCVACDYAALKDSSRASHHARHLAALATMDRTAEVDWKGPFGWELQQTGGMCAALVFSNNTHQVVVTAMDGFFLVGTYLASDTGWENPVGGRWESPPLYNGDEYLTEDQTSALVKECASKAI